MSFPRQQARTRRFTLGVPRAFEISPDGRRVLFLRGRHGTDPVACLWTLESDSGRERVIADPRLIGVAGADLPPEERARRERLRETGGGVVAYTVDTDLTRAAFALSGKLYCVDLDDTEPAPRELPAHGPVVQPVISPRGDRVAYVTQGAVRVIDVDPPAEGSDERDRILSDPDDLDVPGVTWGLAEFIAAEEMGRHRGMWWAPDGSALLVTRVDESNVQRWSIGDPGSPDASPQSVAYPAAGTPNADVSLAVVPQGPDAGMGAPRWVGWDRTALPYLVTAGWATDPDGRHSVVFTAQSRDQRTLVLHGADPTTAQVSVLRTETDDVWVEIMPGVPARTVGGSLVWIGREPDGGERRLSVGGWVTGPAGAYLRSVVDVDGERVLCSGAPKGRPDEVALWLVAPSDGTRDAVTPVEFPGARTGGVHSGRLRGDTLVLQRRDLETDGVRTLVLRDPGTGAPALAAEIASLAETPELPTPGPHLWAAGERGIPSALVLPSWYDPANHGALPVLLDPYGGPHAQRVLRARPAYLGSQWFAEQGFAVLIADGRGTPGISVPWEQSVRNDLATTALEDQVAALHDAAERFSGLDLDRVAIRGWSFGGYLAALAVLRRPDVFHAAVAGAPVIDWELYDTHYTERYLGLPRERPDTYRASSLLDDAPHLRRPIMLIHGLADDNVVFAHTQRLSSALLAAGRPHTVLPLSGITHMASEESTAENLLLLQVEFLRRSLGAVDSG